MNRQKFTIMLSNYYDLYFQIRLISRVVDAALSVALRFALSLKYKLSSFRGSLKVAVYSTSFNESLWARANLWAAQATDLLGSCLYVAWQTPFTCPEFKQNYLVTNMGYNKQNGHRIITCRNGCPVSHDSIEFLLGGPSSRLHF